MSTPPSAFFQIPTILLPDGPWLFLSQVCFQKKQSLPNAVLAFCFFLSQQLLLPFPEKNIRPTLPKSPQQAPSPQVFLKPKDLKSLTPTPYGQPAPQKASSAPALDHWKQQKKFVSGKLLNPLPGSFPKSCKNPASVFQNTAHKSFLLWPLPPVQIPIHPASTPSSWKSKLSCTVPNKEVSFPYSVLILPNQLKDESDS